MKQKFRQKFLTEISATFLKMRRFFWFFCKKNPKIAILRFLLLNTEGSEVKIFSFFGMSLVRAQTWWTTLKTCGPSLARYGAILQHMEPKIAFFSHFWSKNNIFMIFDMALERRAPRRNFWNFLRGRNKVSDGARAQKFDPAHGTTLKTSINIPWCRFQWQKWPKLAKIMDFWCSVARGVWFQVLKFFFFSEPPIH